MANLAMKSQVLGGLFWKLIENCGRQGMQFFIQIILARLLLPSDYGVIAIIVIFISVAAVFVDSGFSTALIQKKNVDELDLSSVFYLSISIAGILYTALYFAAPLIADFYNESQIVAVLRVLALTLFFSSVNSVQYAVLSRKMEFRKVFFSSLGGILCSGVLGITMAFKGFGVWALVAQYLSNQLVSTFILWFTVQWRPQKLLSLDRISSLFAFGGKLLCSSLLDVVYNNIYGLIIGKLYNSAMLGYFVRGEQFPKLIIANVNGAIASVMMPALSANQENRVKVKAMIRRSIVTSCFVIFPLMTGLAVCAEPVVKLLLTDKWLPCVPFLQIMCISYAFWPIHVANLQSIKALGRSDIFLELEIIKKCIGATVLFISVPYGIYVMVALMPVTSFISTAINSYPNKKILNYSFKEQWKDIMPSLVLSILMGVMVYAINFIEGNIAVKLIGQIGIGAITYIGLAFLFKLECFRYLVGTVGEIRHRKQIQGVKNGE